MVKNKPFIYNYINNLSIKSSQGNTHNPAQEVNWCEVIVTNASGKKLYHNSFVTDIEIHLNNIEDITLAGRTRWKI